jgi:hypothetical protein
MLLSRHQNVGQNVEKTKYLLLSRHQNVGQNVEKTKYMLLSRHQNVGQNRDVNIANRSFENVSQFKYWGMTVTNEHLIKE